MNCSSAAASCKYRWHDHSSGAPYHSQASKEPHWRWLQNCTGDGKGMGRVGLLSNGERGEGGLTSLETAPAGAATIEKCSHTPTAMPHNISISSPDEKCIWGKGLYRCHGAGCPGIGGCTISGSKVSEVLNIKAADNGQAKRRSIAKEPCTTQSSVLWFPPKCGLAVANPI